jgi:excinuclease ABC subunit A
MAAVSRRTMAERLAELSDSAAQASVRDPLTGLVNRKGLYTDLARWAKHKGYSHLRVDGEFIATTKWPRLDRFKEHTIELPVGDLVVYSNDEAQLRALLATALEHGHGVVSVLSPLDQIGRAHV